MEKQLKVLHISGYALHGGCEKNCYHFIKASPSFHHQIVILDREGPMTNAWRDLGTEVRHLNILSKGLFAFKKELTSALKNTSWDLVICWSTIRLPFQLSSLKGITSNVKVYLGNPVGKNYRPWKDIVLKTLFPVRYPVKLMACSEYVSVSYKHSPYYSAYPIGVSLNPVALPGAPRNEPANPRLTLGMVARLDPIKDHATVIKAFATILKNIPGTELHLVGDGVLRNQLEQLVSELSLSSHVVFHGDVSDVYSHLRSWDVFVYATTPEEGLGSAVAEAMANGLPCLLSDLPMLREVGSADTVEWFKAFDEKELATKAISLLRDGNRRKVLGKSAFDLAAKRFAASRFINDYINDLDKS
jgi:glycosyltransferase involved in cell wall biosynthesis